MKPTENCDHERQRCLYNHFANKTHMIFMTFLLATSILGFEVHRHPRCSQKLQLGSCAHSNDHRLLQRFYFNHTSNSCRHFAWSGCGETGNNFFTLLECQLMCSSQPHRDSSKKQNGSQSEAVQKRQSRRLSFCHHPRDMGPCHDEQRSYYYNAKYKRCEQFVYGGCKGNKNRFATYEACASACEIGA